MVHCPPDSVRVIIDPQLPSDEIAAQIFEFEREIARAFRGIAPRHFEQTLTAAGFLQVLRDLSTFVVELWDVDLTHTHTLLGGI